MAVWWPFFFVRVRDGTVQSEASGGVAYGRKGRWKRQDEGAQGEFIWEPLLVYSPDVALLAAVLFVLMYSGMSPCKHANPVECVSYRTPFSRNCLR